jgi:hypothetical protein
MGNNAKLDIKTLEIHLSIHKMHFAISLTKEKIRI